MALIFITRTQSQLKAGKNVNSVTRCRHLRLKSQYVWVKVKLEFTSYSGRRSSQQDPECERRPARSRAERWELWGEASSPIWKHNQGQIYSGLYFCSQLVFVSTWGEQNEGQYLSLSLPSTLPSLFLSGESSCGSSAAREVEAPGFPLPISWGSQSHFLLFSQTQELFKDGRTLTHKTRHTQRWGTYEQTHPRTDGHPFLRIYCSRSYGRWWRKPSSSV